MKSYLFSFLAISSVSVLLAAPADLTSPAPDDLTGILNIPDASDIPTESVAQTVCPQVHALPFRGVQGDKPVSFSLYVGKVRASDVPELTDMNSCSPLSFSDVCGGTQVAVHLEPDGTKVVRTAAYNKQTKNVVCYEQMLSHEDPNYTIFKGTLNQMTMIDETGAVTEIPKETIPQSILDLEEKEILTLWYGDKFSYAIYATCDLKSVWVSYAKHIVDENLESTLQEEIDKKLTELGFVPSEFTTIDDVKIPISVDRCLNPISK